MKSLGDRMKGYENVTRTYLPRRTPMIIRIDGKAFHTWTKGLITPFDSDLKEMMCETAAFLCENISGAKMAFWQSDEISILVTDYDNLETEAWFNKNVQKTVSVSASMATAVFNKAAIEHLMNKPLAFFDSRVFTLSKEEVANYFIWRQEDATRNSIQTLAREHFSHKECHKKSCNKLQDKLLTEKDVNWNDLKVWEKRGAVIVKVAAGWVTIDPPIFTQDRNFIERLI